jgi:hypothetical protein
VNFFKHLRENSTNIVCPSKDYIKYSHWCYESSIYLTEEPDKDTERKENSKPVSLITTAIKILICL